MEHNLPVPKIKAKNSLLKTGGVLTSSALDTVDGTLARVTKEADIYIKPIRNTTLKRFPTLFLLLTTAGVTTTILALEKIVADVAYLDAHPFLMLILGITILALTGTLYKKLD